VKSSYREEFKEKYTQKEIYSIIVKPYHKLEEIKKTIIAILEKAKTK